MDKKEFNETLQRHFDEMNAVGLGEMLIFSDSIARFVETPARRARLINVVTERFGYQTSAREFVKKISYEDFKAIKGISEITALGFKLYLMYGFGIDWEKPNVKVKGIV